MKHCSHFTKTQLLSPTAHFLIAQKVGKDAVKGRDFRLSRPLTNPTLYRPKRGTAVPLLEFPRGHLGESRPKPPAPGAYRGPGAVEQAQQAAAQSGVGCILLRHAGRYRSHAKGLARRGYPRGCRPLDAFFVSFCALKKTPPPRVVANSARGDLRSRQAPQRSVPPPRVATRS